MRVLHVSGGSQDAGLSKAFVEELRERHAVHTFTILQDDQVKMMQAALKFVTNKLGEVEYDAVLVVGDRLEMLGAAIAARLRAVPVIHVGGDDTSGHVDDQTRRAIAAYATHAVGYLTAGDPGLDDLRTRPVGGAFDQRIKRYYVLVSCHPDSTDPDLPRKLGMELRSLKETYDVVAVVPNRDAGWEALDAVLREHAEIYYYRLDRPEFLWLVQHARYCVGNSSAFVTEAPAFGTPVILVGKRQAGRSRVARHVERALDSIRNSAHP